MSGATCNRKQLDVRIRHEVDEWSPKARATCARFPGRVDSPYYCNNSARLTVLDAWSPSFAAKRVPKRRRKKVDPHAHIPNPVNDVDTQPIARIDKEPVVENVEEAHLDQGVVSTPPTLSHESVEVKDNSTDLPCSSGPVSPTPSTSESLEEMNLSLNKLEIKNSSRPQSSEPGTGSEHSQPRCDKSLSSSDDNQDVADVFSLLAPGSTDSSPSSLKAVGKRRRESDVKSESVSPDASSPTGSTSPQDPGKVRDIRPVTNALDDDDVRPSKRPKTELLHSSKPSWATAQALRSLGKITILPGPTPGSEIIQIDDSSDEEG
ncbi:hypothetical protein QCA50_004485 [Cerrena zonata]|uniref:Uncharacterized protein n=1 Tax=Cerrena zonata TaxID=2478898 RepID=A0AAW0GHT7_9APHY